MLTTIIFVSLLWQNCTRSQGICLFLLIHIGLKARKKIRNYSMKNKNNVSYIFTVYELMSFFDSLTYFTACSKTHCLALWLPLQVTSISLLFYFIFLRNKNGLGLNQMFSMFWIEEKYLKLHGSCLRPSVAHPCAISTQKNHLLWVEDKW